MAKHKNRRSRAGKTDRRGHPRIAPPTQRAAGPSATLIDELNMAIGVLADVEAGVRQHRLDEHALFEVDELEALLRNAGQGLVQHVDEFAAAAELVAAAAPLASAYGNGNVWAGRQRPRYVVRLAELATTASTTTSYKRRLSDAETTRAVSRECPHLSVYGTSCGGQRVRLVDGTRAETCWNHLAAERRTEIRDQRDGATAARGCPRCHASYGQPCTGPDGRATTIHSSRLHPPSNASTA